MAVVELIQLGQNVERHLQSLRIDTWLPVGTHGRLYRVARLGDLVTEWTTTAARPDPMRLRLESYPVIDTIAARYGDMDANGHLNNLALESLHENARATMNRELLPSAYDVTRRRIRLVTSQNAVHFLAEAHWPATIATGAGVGRIGTTSYVASTGLFINGTCVGVCDTVLVALGDDGPVPLTDEFRAALQTVLMGATGP